MIQIKSHNLTLPKIYVIFEIMKRIIFSLLLVIPLVLSCNTTNKADDPWAEAHKIVETMTKVSFPELSVNITDFGAVAGDPSKLSHEAINLAIASVSQRGGGTVNVPPGVFYTGPITLLSNVNLHLSEGSTL